MLASPAADVRGHATLIGPCFHRSRGASIRKFYRGTTRTTYWSMSSQFSREHVPGVTRVCELCTHVCGSFDLAAALLKKDSICNVSSRRLELCVSCVRLARSLETITRVGLLQAKGRQAKILQEQRHLSWASVQP